MINQHCSTLSWGVMGGQTCKLEHHLQAFKFFIVHMLGKHHMVVDYLSKIGFGQLALQDMHDFLYTATFVYLMNFSKSPCIRGYSFF